MFVTFLEELMYPGDYLSTELLFLDAEFLSIDALFFIKAGDYRSVSVLGMNPGDRLSILVLD